ncbi:hypothetical protein DFH08DRAFT_978259 [Mycena albidolilacea]|uniref:Uncharacterized protein n=1 Tax=Mycena albidolilacea TaxID=1033008 RepID=A0AAD6YZV6_9AGAR|nr:hypothetical protein DFH08DRAFT_978259 [Mycena albidolilacea]
MSPLSASTSLERTHLTFSTFTLSSLRSIPTTSAHHLRPGTPYYAAPRTSDSCGSDKRSERICVPDLEELSLTDLDLDHLTHLLHMLELPWLTTLALDLPEQDFAAVPQQDFTGVVPPIVLHLVVQMIAGVLPSTFAPAAPSPSQHSIPCASLRSNARRPHFELDFSYIRDPEVICGVLLETIALPLTNTDAEETRTTSECEHSWRPPVLLWLEETRLFGLAGEHMHRLIWISCGMRGVPAIVGMLVQLVFDAVVTRGLDTEVELYYCRLRGGFQSLEVWACGGDAMAHRSMERTEVQEQWSMVTSRNSAGRDRQTPNKGKSDPRVRAVLSP